MPEESWDPHSVATAVEAPTSTSTAPASTRSAARVVNSPDDVPDNAIRVLLTGFGPFGRYKVNPATTATEQPEHGVLFTQPPPTLGSEAAESRSGFASQRYRPVYVQWQQIACVYRIPLETIPKLHDDSPAYDLMLHVGAGLPGQIRIETKARRFGFTKKTPDIEGHFAPLKDKDDEDGPRGFAGEEWANVPWNDGEDRVQTEADANAIIASMREAGVDVVRSEDAGLYLCEALFFASQSCALKTKAKGCQAPLVCFMHITPEDDPYSREDLRKIVDLYIWTAARSLESDAPGC